ncbi:MULTISPECIES: FAD-binding protein [Rhodococcus]|uniref:L-aspartate oxidase n=1 Tax=Rhodococcus oxybenzonivorans TaxID=1990687 RepID=A0AAE4UYH6_9NOCA|nr:MULTISPECIES: FAD-binding protein [Rhodococcus]MDV7245825.1 FAD-binding protein [Rhodococcus oxybenzonivorans]MDV7264859.1 FAD-binding protein [Rhodococcus oxybenzonivorans]MDV7277371.1 FAD-binding protein [Rhodococcus oxybenzonivorans]MDV7336941.1 FAD-binding protein [Rhodococcus oxybenzonivorans]MDV7347083.1 FAD-binding protein [Rhodococcus oxybenzonivorans]
MTELLDLSTDVLVIGGGPAGAWAALRAAQSGADVVLVDKGYCGTSGATAPSGTGVWYVQPDPAERAKAKASRETLGGHLADHQWMDRVLHQTYVNMNLLGEEGRYPFPVDPDTRQQIRTGLQGPEYMRRMRAWIKRAGVRILDHSPALELLVDADGVVRGAAGYQRQDHRDYRVAAGAVVIASGGCAFLSRALGTNVDTGDGALMAAEVGATFSGMEFSNAYAIVPANSTITKTAYYGYATFFRADGSVLEGAGSTKGRSVIARTLLSEPVYAQLDRADDVVQRQMRLGQPNFFLQFDRRGINPFTDRFEVSMLAEGTVRGTGGIDVVDNSCATTVPGLFAAGDAATRERICGGFTGGGSHNSAWAMSSGSWAGTGAAGFARSVGRIRASELRAVGRAGLRPTSRSEVDAPAVVAAAQAELLPYEKNLLRDGGRVQGALDELESLWTVVSSGLGADSGDQRVRARQAAAITAVGRWMYHSALARTETRGMSKRADFPDLDLSQHHHILTGGLDEVWTAAGALKGAELQVAS